MIKVCHVGTAHKRYDTRIFYKECVSLAKAGYDVTYLTPDDGLPEEMKDGVRILPVKGAPRTRFIKRFLKYNAVMLKKALELDADIYHLHEWEILPWSKELKKRGKKVIFDCHENYFGQIMDSFLQPFYEKCIALALYKYCETNIRNVDRVIAVTPTLVQRLKLKNYNTVMVTNYPIVSDRTPNVCKALALPTLVFAGGISAQWNHENILKAIENLDVEYMLMGPVEKNYLQQLKNYKAWTKVRFLGNVSHEEVWERMNGCLAGISILSPSRNTFGKIGTLGNNKLFEQMQAGLPVICTDFVLWKKIVDKWKCGICVDPTNVGEIMSAICYLIEHQEEAYEMGQNAKKAVKEEFNWGIEVKKLRSLYGGIDDE